MINPEDTIEAMRNHENVADVQANGCAALGNLVTNDANVVTVDGLGGIEVIVQAMRNHENEANVQEYGCAALANLAMNDANRVTVSALGGIEVIVQAMRNHESVADVQAYGCAALKKLSINDANIITVSALGGIEVILQAMKNHDSVADVQAYGCAALCNLATNDALVIVSALGGIEVIEHAIENHENVANVQECGRAALWKLTMNDANLMMPISVASQNMQYQQITTPVAAPILPYQQIPWRTVIEQLRGNRDHIDDRSTLSVVRQRIECHGRSASTEELVELIDMYPKELAFSLLLCTLRFPVHSRILMDKILQAIEDYSKEQMDYCILKFQGDKDKEKNADTIIGEAMTLIFSFFDDYTANAQSGNLEAIYLVRQRYPKSILYIDAHEFTPLHGVCCALNMDIFRYFINWHLQENPKGRGGLYNMNDSGISSMDTLIDTQHDIVPQLKWLRSRALLESKDVEKWLLVHRSAHSSSRETIQFFINLYPSGVMSEDDDGNLPITLHLGLRYRSRNSFSDEDYAITKLLISEGIKVGGIDTIGGLFHQEPDEEKSCTLDALLKEVGEASHEKLWNMIDKWIEEATVGDYTLAPIVHAAILNRKHMSAELFKYVLSRYKGKQKSNEDGVSPLMYAVKLGATWDGCVSHLLKDNLMELTSSESETMLPILPFAASRKDPDISMLYEFARRSPWMFND